MSSSVVDDLEVRTYGDAIRRRWWIVVMATIAVVVVSSTLDSRKPKVYQSSAEVMIVEAQADWIFGITGTRAVSPERAIDTNIALVRTVPVYDAVAKRLGPQKMARLSSYWGVGSGGNADVMRVSAQSVDPQVAQEAAQVISQEFIKFRVSFASESQAGIAKHMQEQVGRLRNQVNAANKRIVERKTKIISDLSVSSQNDTHQIAIADTTTTTQLNDDPEFQRLLADRESLLKLQVEFEQRAEQIRIDTSIRSSGPLMVSNADLPKAPIGPSRSRRTITAGIIGMALGIAGALMSGLRDSRVRVPADLRLAGAPQPLAWIPAWTLKRRSLFLRRNGRLNARARTVASTVRTLAACLLSEERPFIIGVTGLRGGEGVSSVSAALARAYAQAGRSVVLIDTHLPTWKQSELFAAPLSPGLSEASRGLVAIEEALHATNTPGVVLMPGGNALDAWDLVASPNSRTVLSELAARFDVVMLDLPPVLQSAAASTIAPVLSAAVVVAGEGWTRRADLRSAMQVLEPGELVTVLNAAPRPGFSLRGFHVKSPFSGGSGRAAKRVPLVSPVAKLPRMGMTVGEFIEDSAA